MHSTSVTTVQCIAYLYFCLQSTSATITGIHTVKGRNGLMDVPMIASVSTLQQENTNALISQHLFLLFTFNFHASMSATKCSDFDHTYMGSH